MIRLVTFTTLYPNAVDPRHGIFVETRLRHLLESGAVESRVVAPVPWFPSTNTVFGRYARLARVPGDEQRHGIAVSHPRYAAIPKIGMGVAPRLLARAGLRALVRLRESGYEFDAIDAHYFYPDGVAATLIGERVGRPVVITARGTDVNVIAQLAGPGAAILRAANRAAAIIAVATALKERLVAQGVDPAKIRVMRNGVDLERFKPLDRALAQIALGLSPGTWIASVGNLVPEKGHDIAIAALTMLPGTTRLLIVGSGPGERMLRRQTARLGLSDRVRLTGTLPQHELARVYSACEVLMLASSREGWPNVLLESLACGTPIVTTDVGAAREIVCDPVAGTVVAERTASAIAREVARLLQRRVERGAVRRYAERFCWEETTRAQIDLFATIARRKDRCDGLESDYALSDGKGCRGI